MYIFPLVLLRPLLLLLLRRPSVLRGRPGLGEEGEGRREEAGALGGRRGSRVPALTLRSTLPRPAVDAAGVAARVRVPDGGRTLRVVRVIGEASTLRFMGSSYRTTVNDIEIMG